MAASIWARCSRARSSRAAMCCRSKAIVAPSGSCSSSVPAVSADSMIPRSSRSSPLSRSSADARSAASRSYAPACPVTPPGYQPTAGRVPGRGRSGGHGQLAGAVLAPGGGHRDVGRLALGTRLGGGRVAEHGPAAPLHVGAVRDNDQVIDDGQEDDEVDDRGDEGAEVDVLPVDGPAESLPGRSPTRDRVDQRRDDVVRESLDQGAERQGHHQTNRDDDQVTLHQEVLEALQHDVSSVRTTPWTNAAPTAHDNRAYLSRPPDRPRRSCPGRS